MTTTYSMTKHVSKFLFASTAVVIALIALALVPVFVSPASAQENYRIPQSSTEIDLTFAPLVKEVSPAVVNIYTKKTVRGRASPFDSRFRMGGMPRERVQNSLGSGVIVGPDGVVVTNNHVIEGADELLVVLSDRREYLAELILADERTDLAVLQIDVETPLPTLPYADTRTAEVGDLVLAIGNPFGVGQTVTSGIISATARTDVGVSDFAFFLQTDAAVNPGNSGGALVNVSGELVGVNTAIFSRSGGSNGIGFAIPSEMVKRVVDAAVNEGTLVRPWLGLKGQSVTFDIAKSQGLDRPVGVIVTEVFDDGPADRAGLRRGDIITAVDGREVYDERGLKFLAATEAPGSYVTLDTRRAQRDRVVRVRLQPPPGTTKADLRLLQGAHPFNGAEVAQLSPRLAEEMGRDPFATGILVTRIMRRGYARRVVRPGDLIVGVNGQKINSLDELEDLLSDQERRTWQLEIDRNGRKITGSVRL